VSLDRQVRFAFIVTFIVAGGGIYLGIVELLGRFHILKGLYTLVYAAALATTGIFVLKKSIYAIHCAVVTLILLILGVVAIPFVAHTLRLMVITNPLYAIIQGAFSTALVFSPLSRGILAIRDLKKEENPNNASITVSRMS